MKKINIYLLNIGNATATSGVDRYLNVLLKEINAVPTDIRLYKIEMIRDRSRLFHERIEKENYTEIIIPFPLEHSEIIGERYWMRKYNRYAFSLIRDLFDEDALSILHLHTLNLIDLAQYIKDEMPVCKIITHLHCIPWKNYYNSNRKKFNMLYSKTYLPNRKAPDLKYFLTNNCELDSYAASDRIVTVTDCAGKFLREIMKIPARKISLIPNGLFDVSESSVPEKNTQKPSGRFDCLYVGVLTESKGIFFILDALQKLRTKGYNAHLNIAGACSPKIRKKIESCSTGLSINLLGRISFEELKEYYRLSDIGVIASLQEQCSYVAIEMAMFGLPVVTTAVDGLDEMFTDGVNALKVKPVFSKAFGLRVDTDMLAEKMIALIEDEALRAELGKNARKLYEERFTSERMIQETITIYKELAYE